MSEALKRLARPAASTILALLLASFAVTGCDTSPNQSEVGSMQHGGVTPAAYEACVEADNAANEAWRVVSEGRKAGDISNVEFTDRLRKMIELCRPILPLFERQLDPEAARVAAICAAGYREKIEAYELLLFGVTGDSGAFKLVKGAELLRQCDQRAAELQQWIPSEG